MRGDMRVLSATACVLAAALIAAACETGITNPQDVVFPESDVSYGRHVKPLLDLGCAFSGCHNDIDRAGGVNFTSYIDLFSMPGLVRPGDSTGSVLWQTLTRQLPHFAADIGKLVSAKQAHGVAVWIQEGASNN